MHHFSYISKLLFNKRYSYKSNDKWYICQILKGMSYWCKKDIKEEVKTVNTVIYMSWKGCLAEHIDQFLNSDPLNHFIGLRRSNLSSYRLGFWSIHNKEMDIMYCIHTCCPLDLFWHICHLFCCLYLTLTLIMNHMHIKDHLLCVRYFIL